MRHVKIALILVLAALVLAVAYHAYAQSSGAVTMQGNEFQPKDVTIDRGGTVTWTNQDSLIHDVKFSDSESPDLKKGQSYSKTFDKVGTFDYICDIHPVMKGRVIVK